MSATTAGEFLSIQVPMPTPEVVEVLRWLAKPRSERGRNQWSHKECAEVVKAELAEWGGGLFLYMTALGKLVLEAWDKLEKEKK